MEKILLVGAFDECFHPYATLYDDILGKLNKRATFIFWNRSGFYDLSKYKNLDIKFFDYPMNTYKGIIYKIKGYIKYKRFINLEIKRNKYEKIVVFTTQMGILIKKLLSKKYTNNYIFDYRDETYERKFQFYKRIVSSIIKNSKFTVISSPGFKVLFNNNFDGKMIVCHNVKRDFFDIQSFKKKSSEKKRYVFWGMIRQVDYFKKVIKSLSDKDNEIHFYGDGYIDDLKKMVLDEKFQNVFVHGKYKQSDIANIAKNTDFLINTYSNNSVQEYSLTVKMYEGIKYGLPMIIQKNSFMEEYLGKYNYPFVALDVDENEKILKVSPLCLKSKDNKTILDVISNDMEKFNKKVSEYLGDECE